MKQSRRVFCQKCIIKKGEIFKIHTILRFRLTQVLPLNLMNLLIITPLTPKKISILSFQSHGKVLKGA